MRGNHGELGNKRSNSVPESFVVEPKEVCELNSKFQLP